MKSRSYWLAEVERAGVVAADVAEPYPLTEAGLMVEFIGLPTLAERLGSR